jgi:epoxyqueuosine reductase QueG
MEGLAWGLIEWIITFAVAGAASLNIWALSYLKTRVDDVAKSQHELELKLIAEYASKADLKEVVRDSLAPLRESIAELKGDLKATVAAIDGYRRWGPPE